MAAQAATEVFLDHELERIKDRLRRQDREPPEWQAASYVSGSTVWMTAAELTEIKDQLTEIQQRYGDRDEDPGPGPRRAGGPRLHGDLGGAPPARATRNRG